MSGLGLFWWIVVVIALVSYFGLACAITVGGFFDLKKMFRRLNEAHNVSKEPDGQASEGSITD